MNIGILVYSQTGNTLSVAERLAERLTSGGHTAAIERVTLQGVSGKPVVLFFTQHLRHAWLGGSKAIRQMTALCEAKGGRVCGSGGVGWSRKDRETRIAELLDRLSGAICPA